MRSVLLALFVTGCTAVTPSSLLRLKALSPLEADPAQIEVVLLLPEGLGIRPGSATLRLAATRRDTGAETGRNFTLSSRAADAHDFPADDVATAQHFGLAAGDVGDFRALQSEIAAWKAEAPDATEGTLAVALGGCTIGGGPSADAVASVYARTENGGAYFPIISNGPLARLLDPAQTGEMPPCPAAGKAAGIPPH
ncbi:MAG: hypothetical protein KDE08_01180 [Rhodobacteraceae bacterium]|nr:hypothetical protein [Paracoccaceae bacterium]